MAGTYVRIPKAQMSTYWPRPWTEVLHAAEAHEDGLSVESPPFVPMRAERPERSRYPDDAKGERLFDNDLEHYERAINAAYVYEGDGPCLKGKTSLFQQNWGK